jgi:hypothetical protein
MPYFTVEDASTDDAEAGHPGVDGGTTGCSASEPPQIDDRSYSCPSGYVLGFDDYNAISCCLVDGGASTNDSEAGDAMGDANSN